MLPNLSLPPFLAALRSALSCGRQAGRPGRQARQAGDVSVRCLFVGPRQVARQPQRQEGGPWKAQLPAAPFCWPRQQPRTTACVQQRHSPPARTPCPRPGGWGAAYRRQRCSSSAHPAAGEVARGGWPSQNGCNCCGARVTHWMGPGCTPAVSSCQLSASCQGGAVKQGAVRQQAAGSMQQATGSAGGQPPGLACLEAL